MNFAEAMKEVLDGKSVRASNWVAEAYISTDHLIPVTLYSLGELLALNWEIYPKSAKSPGVQAGVVCDWRLEKDVLTDD